MYFISTAVYQEIYEILKQSIKNFGLKEANLINIGGGLGINYQYEAFYPQIHDLETILSKKNRNDGFRLMMEPGRSLIGNAGIMLTSGIGFGTKSFLLI